MTLWKPLSSNSSSRIIKLSISSSMTKICLLLLIILYLVFFNRSEIKLDPTKPAPPVITMIFFIILIIFF